MINNINSDCRARANFARAQRAYDAQTPEETPTKECPKCEGGGLGINPDAADYGETCHKCGGCGEVDMTNEDFQDAADARAETRYENKLLFGYGYSE